MIRKASRFTVVAAFAVLIAACGSNPPIPTPSSPSTGVSTTVAASSSIAQFTQNIATALENDLNAASALDKAAGHNGRAATYAAEALQVQDCENDILAAVPNIPMPSGSGVIATYEAGVITVTNGISSNVKIDCTSITPPPLPALP